MDYSWGSVSAGCQLRVKVQVSSKKINSFSSSSTIHVGLSKSQSSLPKQNLFYCTHCSETIHLNISLELENQKEVCPINYTHI